MRLFKYILLFSLPIMLFVNLWYFARGGADNYRGFGDVVEYVKTFHGFDYTWNVLNSMSGMVMTQFNAGAWIAAAALGLLYLLIGPVILLGTLIADIIGNVVWFFGWIWDIPTV